MKGYFAAFLCAALLASVSGAAGAQQQEETLTLLGGSVALPLSAVLTTVADKEGFFTQQHLNVVEQLVNSPSAAAALVATGKGDVCSISAEAVMQGYERGLKLEYFFNLAPRLTNVLAVLDDSPIHTLSDFKGKNIGVITVGSAGEVTGKLILEGAGIRGTDVTWSPIGQGPQALSAVMQHRVDAVAFPYPEVVPMELAGSMHMRVWRHPTLRDVSAAGMATTPDNIANKPDAFKRFARGLAMASVFEHANRVASARIFLEAQGQHPSDADVAREAESLRLLADDIPYIDQRTGKIGALPMSDIRLYAQALNDQGMTKAVVPAEAIATNAFIDYANDFDHKAVIALAKKVGNGQ
jgi:NitT/TauT family transport system substrate-binding protein